MATFSRSPVGGVWAMVGGVDRSEVMRSVGSGRRFRYRPVGKPIHKSSVFVVFIGQIKKIGHVGHCDEF